MPIPTSALDPLPFFARLSAEHRRALGQVLVDQRYAASEVIFREGAAGLGCAFIIEGTVHAELDAGAGRRERLATMGVGEIFGEIALLDGGRRTASCITGEEGARIALLSRDDFTLLFEAGNPFAFAMVRLIARQLARRMQHAARVWSAHARSGGS